MAEKIYPASKPPPPQTTAPPPSFPPNKPPLARPVYRPNPTRTRTRRSCCCSICLFLTVTITVLIFLLAVTAAVTYVIYRPHRPTFHVTSLHVTSFNMTSSSKLNTHFNLTLTARNPNKRIVYLIDPADVTFKYKKVKIGEGKLNAFTMSKKNTTTLRTVVTSSSGNERVDDGEKSDRNLLKSELKGKKSVELRIEIGTKIRAKIGSVKTKKVAIRVTCEGVRAGASGASVTGAKCDVDLRIKIWKWTI